MMWIALLTLAQAEPFNPDRPGFADSTGAVPPGALMTEAGVTADTSAVLTAPGLLIRGGLLPGLELRVSAPGLLIPLEDGDISVGATGVGLKGAFEAGPVAASVIATLPMAAASSLEEGIGDPFLGANVGGSLGEALGWTANAVVSPGSWAGSLALGATTGPGGGAYLQGAAMGSGGSVQPLVGIGGNMLLTETLQLDVYADWLPGSSVTLGAGVAKQW